MKVPVITAAFVIFAGGSLHAVFRGYALRQRVPKRRWYKENYRGHLIKIRPHYEHGIFEGWVASVYNPMRACEDTSQVFDTKEEALDATFIYRTNGYPWPHEVKPFRSAWG